MITRAFAAAALLALLATGLASAHGMVDPGLRAVMHLSLDGLPPLPRDPSNRFADVRAAAAAEQPGSCGSFGWWA